MLIIESIRLKKKYIGYNILDYIFTLDISNGGAASIGGSIVVVDYFKILEKQLI